MVDRVKKRDLNLVEKVGTSKRRVVVKIFIIVLVSLSFWITSRYPDLIHEAQRANQDTLTDRNLGGISKDEVMSTREIEEDGFHVILLKIGVTTVNWIETNKLGMSFGIIFGGALLALISPFMAAMKYLSPNGLLGTFLGVLIGTPLGVCANCVAPIGLAMKKKGVSLATTLATMFASPTLNVVAIFMTFIVFPFSLAMTKIIATLFLILIVIPQVVKKFEPQKKNYLPKERVKLIFEEESWVSAIQKGFTSFAHQVFKLSILVIPLMLLAGLLGATIITAFPLENFVGNPLQVSFLLIVAAAIVGTLLPIPMLVDIILVLGLLEAGLNIGLAATLLITMPIYSIFSVFIIRRYFYPKLAGTLFIAVAIVGVIGGLLLNILQPKPELSFKNIIDETPIEQLNGFDTGEGNAWVDYDNDGDLDLFYGKLYQNNGNGDFVLNEASGLPNTMPGMTSIIFGDYDNDNCIDAYVVKGGRGGLEEGGIDNHEGSSVTMDILYHNNCDGTFTDVSQESGINDSFQGRGASWVDYDNDGYLDIYVANAGWYDDEPSPTIGNTGDRVQYNYEPNILYRNNGNGTFTDVTEYAGVIGHSTCKTINGEALDAIYQYETDIRLKPSFQSIWLDYDNDRDLDLFVATDSLISPLYRNNGNGTFTDVTESAGLCVQGTGMGVTAGDYDGDGDLDIYITNIGRNYLWRNNGNETFTEVGQEAGVGDIGWGWDTSFFDYDNDGDLDLYVVNDDPFQEGDINHVVKGSNSLDVLYKNNGIGEFEVVSLKEGIYGDFPKKTMSIGDYNGDGFLDMFITQISELDRKILGNNQLYKNRKNQLYKNLGNDNKFLMVELVGVQSNTNGVGARVVIETKSRTQIREVVSGDGFLSQNSLWQHFGLGQSEKVERLTIYWPSGVVQVLENIESNQKIIVTEAL